MEKEGRRCCRHRDSPASCGEDHGEAAVPLQPMEVWGGAEIHLQPMGPHNGAREAVTSWKGHAGADSRQNLWTHGETGSHIGGGLLAGFFCGGQSPAGVTPHENRSL
ncbi:hypothetical protein HGM15179_002271 [Zosterops borbonicus]|uniref:Uncharacterized protein n=1 Tax=Zosterops borbonicus TaxID=364589 RepID=A0A8K1GV03_9PASS|nr:hypothetical protein HGM15179_002271 [Zosterops borbonicus]